jgi:archaellum component FlaC
MIFAADHRIKSKITSPSITGLAIHSSNGVHIPAGDEILVPIAVFEDSSLFFIFNTPDESDIAFDLVWRGKDGTSAVLVPLERCQRKQGEINVSAGMCYIRWTNAYSWVTPKVVLYAIYLATKKDIEAESERMATLRNEQRRQQKLAEMQKRLNQLEAIVTELDQQVKDTQQEKDILSKTIDDVVSLLAHLHESMNTLNNKLDNTTSNLQTIQSEAGQLIEALHETAYQTPDPNSTSQSMLQSATSSLPRAM